MRIKRPIKAADGSRAREADRSRVRAGMNTGYRFGIEEEFFLADAVSRGTPRRSVRAFHADVHAKLPEVERELLQSQVEIASKPTTRFAEARSALAALRGGLAAIGREHGILVFAAGTHPLARWNRQRRTRKDRYAAIFDEMQMIGRRDVVCGMHVHVEVPRPEDRVDLMNRLLPHTPLLLALSASSPFWQGRATGLAAYRLSVWGEMPRTGLPNLFADAEEYERYVALMVRSAVIKDASFLWWTLRPSIHFPTLELRVADSCTRLEDTLAIAALYRCLVRFAVRTPDHNRGLTGVSRAVASENLWRAQRSGSRASFVEEASGGLVSVSDHLEATLALVVEDAEALGCEAEVDAARTIIAHGTSADQQGAVFQQAGSPAAGPGDAFAAVVDWLAETTAGPPRSPVADASDPLDGHVRASDAR